MTFKFWTLRLLQNLTKRGTTEACSHRIYKLIYTLTWSFLGVIFSCWLSMYSGFINWCIWSTDVLSTLRCLIMWFGELNWYLLCLGSWPSLKKILAVDSTATDSPQICGHAYTQRSNITITSCTHSPHCAGATIETYGFHCIVETELIQLG